MISSAEICLLIESGEMVSISENNCYSSTQYAKSHQFLAFVHCYEKKIGQKVFFKKEKFRQNYFTVVNEVTVNIDSKEYKLD